jgi:hypothetical protein
MHPISDFGCHPFGQSASVLAKKKIVALTHLGNASATGCGTGEKSRPRGD